MPVIPKCVLKKTDISRLLKQICLAEEQCFQVLHNAREIEGPHVF